MFQRLKGFNLDSFLDSKIAEEQARQRGSEAPPVRRTPSGARRGSARADSPAKRQSSRLRGGGDADGTPVARGPDPSEFVIEDEDVPSRATTPRPAAKEEADGDNSVEKPKALEEEATHKDDVGTEKPTEKPASKPLEKAPLALPDGDLPQDIQQKLRKLQKLESRYHDLLRSYRVAHARVTAIEPFEASLRENTPLTSIADPTALVEYLSQLNLKGDMVMEELKRVSGDRDVLKAKLEEAEKQTKDAYDEAAGTRKDHDDLKSNGVSDKAQQAQKEGAGEDLFSYESEAPRLQEELQESVRKVEELTEENARLREDLEASRISHKQAVEELHKPREAQSSDGDALQKENAELRQSLDKSEALLQASDEALGRGLTERQSQQARADTLPKRIENLCKLIQSSQSADDIAKDRLQALQQRADTTENELSDIRQKYADLEDKNISNSSSNKKKVDTLDNLVKAMRTQLSEADAMRKSTESDLANLRKQLQEAEQERDSVKATSKNPAESEGSDLQSRLDQAERDRDDAFQILADSGIIDSVNKAIEETFDPPQANNETSAQSNATDTQIKGESGAAKKKSKNKKKKKAVPTDSTIAGDGGEADTSQKSNDAPTKSSPPETSTLSGVPHLSEAQRSAIRAKIAERNLHASCERTIHSLKTTAAATAVDAQNLRADIDAKQATIERLDARLKGEEELREEIEGLKDDLMHIGNEHVATKDEIKSLKEKKQAAEDEHAKVVEQLKAERGTLRQQGEQLEADAKSRQEDLAKTRAELEAHQAVSGSTSKELEDKLASLAAEKSTIEEQLKTRDKELKELEQTRTTDEINRKGMASELDGMRQKATSLQRDLSAANDLAQTRFKDLTALRDHANQIQPELNKVKKLNEELKGDNDKLKPLEKQSEEMKSEIAAQKTKITDKDTEIKRLRERLKQSTDRALGLEEKHDKSQKALSSVEVQQKEATDAKDRLSRDLSKAQDELDSTRNKLAEMDKQADKLRSEATSAREELDLRSAQQASAQSLMDSMQDQTRELATQMKEVRERCESLEEELADAHRLLSERSREGETMRRLLSDVEGRADARVKEMRERMDLAIEERDRAEDDASVAARRRAREVDDLKTKVKDAEKQRSMAIGEKEAFERRESSFVKQRDELERKAGQAQEELSEVRSAMTQLRDALDEGERQSRELEKERADLKRTLDDRERRLEKLHKGSRSMADEIRSLQNGNKTRQASVQSARSSVESGRVASPNHRNGTVATTGGPEAQPATDYVYLKNVLLQFLEQKDKKHQMQLVPVLGMLLHFDRNDEQKWVTAITTK